LAVGLFNYPCRFLKTFIFRILSLFGSDYTIVTLSKN
jgi:hypothetical protein